MLCDHRTTLYVEAAAATVGSKALFVQRVVAEAQPSSAEMQGGLVLVDGMLLCAETGSGKTIAYTAPVLSRLLFEHERG